MSAGPMRTICLHGAESTGKTVLAGRLAAHFGTELVPEYGRIWAETHGTDFSMADLVAIARTHDAMTRAALDRSTAPVILDTDPLMTAVWADMLSAGAIPGSTPGTARPISICCSRPTFPGWRTAPACSALPRPGPSSRPCRRRSWSGAAFPG